MIFVCGTRFVFLSLKKMSSRDLRIRKLDAKIRRLSTNPSASASETLQLDVFGDDDGWEKKQEVLNEMFLLAVKLECPHAVKFLLLNGAHSLCEMNCALRQAMQKREKNYDLLQLLIYKPNAPNGELLWQEVEPYSMRILSELHEIFYAEFARGITGFLFQGYEDALAEIIESRNDLNFALFLDLYVKHPIKNDEDRKHQLTLYSRNCPPAQEYRLLKHRIEMIRLLFFNDASDTQNVTSFTNVAVGWDIARKICEDPAHAKLNYWGESKDDPGYYKAAIDTLNLGLVDDCGGLVIAKSAKESTNLVGDEDEFKVGEDAGIIKELMEACMAEVDCSFVSVTNSWNLPFLLKTKRLVDRVVHFYTQSVQSIQRQSEFTNSQLQSELLELEYAKRVDELNLHLARARNLFFVLPPLPNNENGAVGALLTLFNLGMLAKFTRQNGYAEKYGPLFHEFYTKVQSVVAGTTQLVPVLTQLSVSYL